MVHRREIDGDEIVLGNQGALWGNAMTWWDHETGSIWSQPIGEAIAGPLKGQTLELLPSTLTTWEAWRSAHPDTQALDVDSWRTSFDLSDMAIVVDRGTDSAAYWVPSLRDAGLVNDVVADTEVAVVIDPTNDQRWAVFSRQLDNETVTLELDGDRLIDVATGTVFDAFTGAGREGPLANQSLDKLASFTSFPDDYLNFFPEGRIWS